MSTNGFEDKGSYPYDDPPNVVRLPGRYLSRQDWEQHDVVVGMVVLAIAFVVGASFGWAMGVLYGG